MGSSSLNFFRLSKIANLWNHRLLMHLETFWNHLEANGQHGQVNPWRCQQMTCWSCCWRHSFLGHFSMTGLTYLNFKSQKCLKKYKIPLPSLVDTGSHFLLVAGLFLICSGWHGSIHFSRSERRELKLRESVQSCGESCTKRHFNSRFEQAKSHQPSPNLHENEWSIDFSAPIFSHVFHQFSMSLQKIQLGGSLTFCL